MWGTMKDEINEWRSTLSLRPLEGFSWAPAPHVNLYSPLLSPRPKDWPAFVYDTGFWIFKDEAYIPPPELEAFLSEGEAPIYMGFGSMPTPDIAAMALMFSNACLALGKRGIFCSGWFETKGVLFASMPHMLHIVSAPHTYLLPRCCCAVHHGGAGTTAATLRAGIPCVVFSTLKTGILKFA